MIIEHAGHRPIIDESTFIAMTATVCGNVRIGKNCRIMYGASIIAEGGSIQIADNCIVLENAVLRSTGKHSLKIGNAVLIGPNAHVVGCEVEDNVFVATGAAIFHGAHLCKNSEVRVNGVVHLSTTLAESETVPIGWVAVGNPAKILPPERHHEIWKIQEPLNFPLTVYGIDRDPNGQPIMPQITKKVVENLEAHMEDQEVR